MLPKKSQQHPKDFPGGHPPQYYPGLVPFDFRVRMGSGLFDAVWPLTKLRAACQSLLKPLYNQGLRRTNHHHCTQYIDYRIVLFLSSKKFCWTYPLTQVVSRELLEHSELLLYHWSLFMGSTINVSFRSNYVFKILRKFLIEQNHCTHLLYRNKSIQHRLNLSGS